MIRALFGPIPPWAYAAFLALLIGMGVAWHALKVKAARQDANDRVEAAYKKGVTDTAAKAKQAAQTETARQRARLQEVSDAEVIKAREAESAANDLRALGRRLRERLAASASASAGAAPASAPGGEAAAAPADVRPDVCGALAERSVELAIHADAATRAGLACERAFDAVRAAP